MKSARRLIGFVLRVGSGTVAAAATQKQRRWAGMGSAEKHRNRCGMHCLAGPHARRLLYLPPLCYSQLAQLGAAVNGSGDFSLHGGNAWPRAALRW